MEKRDYWAWLASNEYFYFDKIQKILKCMAQRKTYIILAKRS